MAEVAKPKSKRTTKTTENRQGKVKIAEGSHAIETVDFPDDVFIAIRKHANGSFIRAFFSANEALSAIQMGETIFKARITNITEYEFILHPKDQ